MTTENIRLRSEFMNTQVIARNTGKRIGVVKEILVDMDRREIVALGLRDNLLSVSGIPKYMYISSVYQTGDVILVEDEDVIEDIDIEAYSSLVNCEVVTEANKPLGKVRDFQFDVVDGKVYAITIASLGLPQIPDQIISTYELSIDDVVTSGPNRLIVFEGSEERLTQITVGILERLGLGRSILDNEEEDYYPPTIKAENQLGTGVPERPPISTPVEAKIPVKEERWDEDEWPEARVVPPVQQKAETLAYEEYEEDNWGDTDIEDKKVYVPYEPEAPVKESQYIDSTEDMWDDDESPQPYNPPPVNIPEKQVEKIPEYEEEAG
ncbi:MAG: PRC-barrel domain-containing protein [Xenococcus sp. MO_188.B8]|nr:PRC-barrel domain-containing protein [Xenococcus sp. MO_188.B8]